MAMLQCCHQQDVLMGGTSSTSGGRRCRCVLGTRISRKYATACSLAASPPTRWEWGGTGSTGFTCFVCCLRTAKNARKHVSQLCRGVCLREPGSFTHPRVPPNRGRFFPQNPAAASRKTPSKATLTCPHKRGGFVRLHLRSKKWTKSRMKQRNKILWQRRV